jgi:hypothetical protein
LLIFRAGRPEKSFAKIATPRKIYARTARILVKVEKLLNRKALLEDPAATLAIDVSELPIERPVKNQKAYYSGKKHHTVKA